MARKIMITDASEIIPILINAYDKNAGVLNAAIRRVYAYARYIGTVDDEEKIRQLNLMLNKEHVYVKYWGSVIALSYNVIKKRALATLISILDTETIPLNGALNFRLNLLKADIALDEKSMSLLEALKYFFTGFLQIIITDGECYALIKEETSGNYAQKYILINK